MGITKEQLTELINTDEGKALIGDIAKSIGYESQDDIKGLKLKNQQLLAAEKSIKEQMQSVKDAYSDIDLEEYKSFKANKGKQDPANDVEVRKIKQQLEQIAKEKDEYRTKLEGSTKRSSIFNAISKAGFDPRFNDALYALFDKQAKVQPDSNGNYSVIVDDGSAVDSIEDFVIKYSKSDNGKAFMPIPEHKGAGAKSYAGSTSKTMKRSDWEQLKGAEKVKAAKDCQIID